MHSTSAQQVFTISNNPDFNVTPATPFRPINSAMDANLNITTLINELAIQDVVVDEDVFFNYEMAVIEDVIYVSGFNLNLVSNYLLLYAHLQNDDIGDVSLFGLSNVIIGTELASLGLYGLLPPIFMPLSQRVVEVGSLHGSTLVDAAIYAAVLASAIPSAYAQLGRSAASSSAFVSVYAGNYLAVVAGGHGSHAMIGFGGPSLSANLDVRIYINVEEGNIYVTGGDLDAFAQIGNRTVGGAIVAGDIRAHARSVQINTPLNGNTILTGGVGPNSESRIGHWHESLSPLVTVGGRINSLSSAGLTMRTGSADFSSAIVGHRVSCLDDAMAYGEISVYATYWDVVLDAHSVAGILQSHCQIGHDVNANNGNATDSIYIEAGGSVTCLSGVNDYQFTLIGHLGENSNDFLSGNIEINTGDSVVLISNLNQFNFSQVGHHEWINGGLQIDANISIRTGGRQLYTSQLADDISSFVKVGHHNAFSTGDIYLLAFDNIDLRSSKFGPAEAIIFAGDTLRLTSNDSINIQSEVAEARLFSEVFNAVVQLDAGKDISFISLLGIPSSIQSPHASEIKIRAADDIKFSQQIIETDLSNGHLWFESDHGYLPGELFGPQIVRNGTGGPFGLFGIAVNNNHIPIDSIGVIKFENTGLPITLSTQAGDINIHSRSTDVNGAILDLRISDVLPFSIQPMTQTGSILIGFEFDPFNNLIDLGDSYENGIIDQWNTFFNGKLFFNANQTIKVELSEIDINEVLLETN